MKAVAIDGPSGAGKSTIARAAAKKLNFIYVDTGALYRSIGLYMLRQGVLPSDADGVTARLPELSVTLGFEGGLQRVYLNGEDVSEAIRENCVSMAASDVSAIPAVREFLLSLQRSLAEENNVIMDGRDIGTVILPNADVKIFLTASPEERAKRRYEELKEKGQSVEYHNILKEIIERDGQDQNRKIAPLKPAEGAIVLDTTGNTLEESIRLLTEIIKKGFGI